jgi:DNA-binding LacI/PurR family transcriptional regulator
VTAIAAVNDLAAVGAMSAVADAGLRVPGDVAITGYDDTFVSAIRQVSLTSVNPDSSGIGTLAAQCVLRRIETCGRPVEEHLLPPRLVTRASSGGWIGGLHGDRRQQPQTPYSSFERPIVNGNVQEPVLNFRSAH